MTKPATLTAASSRLATPSYIWRSAVMSQPRRFRVKNVMGADRWIAAGLPFAGILAGAGLLRLLRRRKQELSRAGRACQEEAIAAEDLPLAPLTPKGTDSPLNTAASATVERDGGRVQSAMFMGGGEDVDGGTAALHGAPMSLGLASDQATDTGIKPIGHRHPSDAEARLRQVAAALAAEAAVSRGEEAGTATEEAQGTNSTVQGEPQTATIAGGVAEGQPAGVEQMGPHQQGLQQLHEANQFWGEQQRQQLPAKEDKSDAHDDAVVPLGQTQEQGPNPAAPATPTASSTLSDKGLDPPVGKQREAGMQQEVTGSIPATAPASNDEDSVGSTIHGGNKQLLRVGTAPATPYNDVTPGAQHSTAALVHTSPFSPNEGSGVAASPRPFSDHANEPEGLGSGAPISTAASPASHSSTQPTRQHSRPLFKALLRDVSAPRRSLANPALPTVYSCPAWDHYPADEPAPAPEESAEAGMNVTAEGTGALA